MEKVSDQDVFADTSYEIMSGISTTSMTNQPQEDPKLIMQLRDDILANEYQKPNHLKSS